MLCAASYNIHGGLGQDRRRDLNRVLAVVRELRADLVGLQEVEWRRDYAGEAAPLEQIASTTGYRTIAGPTIETPHRCYGNVLLTRYPVRAERRVDLSVRGREPRGAIDADVEVYGRLVRVVVTHLGLKQSERRAQVTHLLNELTRRAAAVEVIMGDFNEWWPLGGALGRLRKAYGRHSAPATFPARHPVLALDRIWVRPASHLLSLSVHRSTLAGLASDHLPLKACVKLTQPAA